LRRSAALRGWLGAQPTVSDQSNRHQRATDGTGLAHAPRVRAGQSRNCTTP